MEEEDKSNLIAGTREEVKKTSGQTFQQKMPAKRFSSIKTEQIAYSWKNINAWTGEPTNRGDDNGKKGGKNVFWKNKKTSECKQILNDVTGVVRSGEFLAMMGASGAGKTTLLNALTLRNTEKLYVSGERQINGVDVTPGMLTACSAYIQQDDLFIGTLTVREHLVFQALLRMHKHISKQHRMARVEEVILELGLSKCADTMIGVPGRIKGISGGEMKRLSFASEVLTDPPLMFCDEPTSGLDSYMAQNVVEVLKSMAEKGKTIICIIHQPSSELFGLFDKLLLMTEGRTAFMGDSKDAVSFFSGAGFDCPPNFNPADFFIQTLAIQPSIEDECLQNINRICNIYEKSAYAESVLSKIKVHRLASEQSELLEIAATMKKRSPYKAGIIPQFRAVLWRSWLSVVREPMVLNVRLLQTVVIAVVLGLIYLNQELNQQGIQNINGALFLFLTNMTFQNVFAVINVFCVEVPIFLREHFNGMYRCDIYFISKVLAELPLYVLFPFIFTAICYYMIGLNPAWDRFLVSSGIVVLVANVACSFGYFISCISGSITIALSLAPPFIIPFMLFGGFFLNKGSIPIYFDWIKYLSWFLYGNELLSVNQWENIGDIKCDAQNTTCITNGTIVLQTLDFEKKNVTTDIMALVVLLIGYRVLAFLALLAKTYRKY